MDTGINITLNADLYRAAKSIEDGCDPDYIDDLCKEIAEFHNKNYDFIKNKVMATYRQYFEDGRPKINQRYTWIQN